VAQYDQRERKLKDADEEIERVADRSADQHHLASP
jgi:hypothetical protein